MSRFLSRLMSHVMSQKLLPSRPWLRHDMRQDLVIRQPLTTSEADPAALST